MQPSSHTQSNFLIVLIVAALALAAAVFWPFLKPLALATVFAVVLRGLYERILRLVRGLPGTAALLTIVVGIVFIAIPLGVVGMFVGNEARALYLSLEAGQGQTMLNDILLNAGAAGERFIPGARDLAAGVSTDIDAYAKDGLRWIAGHAGDIFSGVSRFLLSSFIFMIALYYLLRDGALARKALIAISPLPDRDDETILDRLERAVNSIIKGSLVIALIQGVLTTIGFAIFGVPSPALWGTVAALAALIPGVGTSLVIAPAVAFLFVTGSVLPALGLFAWGAFGVGLIDNLLAPRLIGKGMHLHPLLVLLAVLGGIMFFGMIGIFLGPLVVSFFFALLSLYAASARATRS